MKRIISVIISVTVLFASLSIPATALETGGFGSANGSVMDNLDDLITPVFNKDYAVSFNDFESVSEYSSTNFSVSDTGRPAYGKAFTVGKTTSWDAVMPMSSVTYTWNDNSYVMFGEPLEVGKNYILSYDYMSEVTEGKVDGYAFSLAPVHDDFSNGTGDWTHFPLYYTDLKWRTVTHGFTASDSKLNLKVNTCGYNAKSYIDNMLVMSAAEIKLADASGTTRIVDLSDNALSSAETRNGKTLVAMGEPVSFKIEFKRGMELVAVKHGDSLVTADAEGYYNVSSVTADITVETALNYNSLLDRYYIEDDYIYLTSDSNVFSVGDAANVDSAFISVERAGEKLTSDETIKFGDTIKIHSGEQVLATYTAKIMGDVDMNGEVSVTDVINALGYIVNSAEGMATDKIYDTNNSGKVTVSDIVIMRKIILNQNISVADGSVIESMDKFTDDLIAATGVEISDNELENGIYNEGNRSLIADVLRKAVRGEDITIVCMGGSITEGGTAKYAPSAESGITTTLTAENNNYCDWLCRWFEAQFDCKVNKVNAGISATDTIFGIHRLEEDVLSYNPDLVVVEYSVNDTPDALYKQASYEAIVRKLLSEDIATMMLAMCVKAGYSSQNLHEPISDLYHIPMVSFKDAYFSNSKFQYFYPDSTHPNMIGMPLTALLLTNLLQKCYEDIESIASYSPLLPESYVNAEAGKYEGAYIADIADIAAGNIDGITLVDMGSFQVEPNKTTFGYREHYGVTAEYSENYQPMVLKIDSCKSLFVQMLRSNKIADGSFKLEINGKTVTSDTFTCSANGVADNIQPESIYFWSSTAAYASTAENEITVKIYPTNQNSSDKVTLYSLLIA